MAVEIEEPLPPGALAPSEYAINPEYISQRAALSIKGIVSLKIRSLFPEIPEPIYRDIKDLQRIGDHTVKALSKVDMSMIKPTHSVNILASHHGFVLSGGEPYAEMLKTIKSEVEKRTGCKNIRLRAGVGLRFRETEEYIERFGLDEYFDGKAIGIAPVDEGIPIETEIGTFYGLKRAYDADWIIHAHNCDIREIHFHRMVDRAIKPFAMSYARIETRSTYHLDLGPRAANFAARAIFDSPFIQKKWSFACFLTVAPSGIIGVDADNNLYSLNDRLTRLIAATYGKFMTLLSEIDECIVILDSIGPIPYTFAGGVIFANFCSSNIDIFDLDISLPGYTWYSEALYDEEEKPLISDVNPINPAIKSLIINNAWTGYPSEFWPMHIPTIIVGDKLANHFKSDPQNSLFMNYTLTAKNLEAAVNFAVKITGTDKILIFDGALGGINVSRPLAQKLAECASKVSDKVENILMPKWLRQRGLEA